MFMKFYITQFTIYLSIYLKCNIFTYIYPINTKLNLAILTLAERSAKYEHIDFSFSLGKNLQ